MKQRQGKKAQRKRSAATERSLRARLRDGQLETNTAHVLDLAILALCKRPEYAKLAADIDEEMERLIEEKNIREVGGARRVRVD